MKLLVDMNLSPMWCDRFIGHGWESIHWSTFGEPDAPDTTIMAYAAAAGWVVVTHDLDFGAILVATGATAPSVVQIRSVDLSPDVIGDAVVAAMENFEHALEAGALVTVSPVKRRARVLLLTRG